MSAAPVPSNGPTRKVQAAWLAFAVSAHALLLLLPGWNAPARPEPVAFNIRLISPPQLPPANPPLQENGIAEPPVPNAPPETTAQMRIRESEPAPIASQELEPFPFPEPAAKPLTAVRLLESARTMKELLPDPPEMRQLGQAPALAIPSNWRPAIALEANRFYGLVAPARTEVLDRWLAADGSHNVVVETAGGHTFCGHAAAWNPMQPLVEHLMMFRPCGGGGKRGFEMPDRGDLPDYGALR